MPLINVRQDGEALANYHEADFAVAEDPFWFGDGAAQLGLSGKPTRAEFRRLCRGKNPGTGEQLTARDMPNARRAFEFVFSAPKSVSLFALAFDDPRIVIVHDAAVREGLHEIEKLAMTRVRRGGADFDRVTVNVAACCFTHCVSRDNDPHLHTHVQIFNATFDTEDDDWKALQAIQMFRQQKLLLAVYLANLRDGLRQLGYRTTRVGNAFEIVGVPPEVITTFSKRKAEIDRIEKCRGSSGNAAMRSAIARESRSGKHPAVDLKSLQKLWLSQLSSDQVMHLQAVRDGAIQPVKTQALPASEALVLAARHLFGRRSIVPVQDLLRDALLVGAGASELGALRNALTQSDAFIIKGDQATTPAVLAAEKLLIDAVKQGIGACLPLNSALTTVGQLSPEQQEALYSLSLCRDKIIGFVGVAGSGKTTVLGALEPVMHFDERRS